MKMMDATRYHVPGMYIKVCVFALTHNLYTTFVVSGFCLIFPRTILTRPFVRVICVRTVASCV